MFLFLVKIDNFSVLEREKSRRGLKACSSFSKKEEFEDDDDDDKDDDDDHLFRMSKYMQRPDKAVLIIEFRWLYSEGHGRVTTS